METQKLKELLSIAMEIDYSVRIILDNGHSMILDPCNKLGPIEIVEIKGKSFIKLKNSLVLIEDIDTAFLYKGGETNAK